MKYIITAIVVFAVSVILNVLTAIASKEARKYLTARKWTKKWTKGSLKCARGVD